ncbi:hypothetical protein C8Q77DRAFT_1079251 [Trametes polyzona]|nr:hypothetical protein C8Q77DRAFT_1079251 [Trametes polyzona]
MPDDHQPVQRNNWVGPRGRFIGASGMVFTDQTAVDLYFENYWLTAPEPNDRVAVICIAWGMAMAYLQRGSGEGIWPVNPLGPNQIVVEDLGTYPERGEQMLPPHVRLAGAGTQAIHMINRVPVLGLRLPWHRRIALTRRKGEPLHYHRHEERVGHEAHVSPRIRDLNDEKSVHLTFDVLTLGTQIQNYRRIKSKKKRD